jgi:hypothetical protein
VGPPSPPLILPPATSLSLPRKLHPFLKPVFLLFLLAIFDLLAQPIFATEIWSICSLKREMNNHTYGEFFEREEPRSSRPSRSTTQFMTSYNEDLVSPSIGDEGDDGDAHPSTLPCTNFLSDVGILEDFLLLVDRVGFTTYMLDESDQYAMFTKIFVESFKFLNSAFEPSIAFKIYDKSITMSLERFCNILGIAMFGTAKKIQNRPADLLELYRG